MDDENAIKDKMEELKKHDKDTGKPKGLFARFRKNTPDPEGPPAPPLPEDPEGPKAEDLKDYIDTRIEDLASVVEKSIAYHETKIRDAIALIGEKASLVKDRKSAEREKSFAEKLGQADPDKVEAVASIPEQDIILPKDGGLERFHEMIKEMGIEGCHVRFIRKKDGDKA